jgi:Xaa-Pro aminopeptidase
MLEIHAIVSHAQDQAFQAIKSGVTNWEVDRAAREVISQAGHGYGYTHGLGHGIGLETHDPGLNLSEKAPEQELREGMALTIEPGIYLENEFGIRLEDTIIVRPDGYENLTRQDRAIHSI